jgi:hypothetical protein
MKKENKFLDERINRMRLTFFIAYINRLLIFAYLRIQYIFEYVNLIL